MTAPGKPKRTTTRFDRRVAVEYDKAHGWRLLDGPIVVLSGFTRSYTCFVRDAINEKISREVTPEG